MKNLSKFQLALMGLFILSAFGGVAAFALYKGKTGASEQPVPLTIWGSVDQALMDQILVTVFQDKELSIKNELSYRQIPETDFDSTLAQGIATGQGPDIVLFPQELLMKLTNKIKLLPFESYPARSYKDSFIEESELFLKPTGILAFPIVVDPLVMYWNRDLLTNAGVAAPPGAWEEFLSVTPVLTKKDANLNILESGVALGVYDNVSHAKEIIATLLLQGGSPIVTVTDTGTRSVIAGTSEPGAPQIGEAILNFYTQFSNPLSSVYSWNKSLPASLDAFISGELALYFGTASEVSKIRQKNPNLNFDVAAFPQPKNAAKRLTYGRLYGLAVLTSSKNVNQSFTVVGKLAGTGASTHISDGLGLPSARRDVLAKSSNDPYKTLFNASALRSVGWVDPDPKQSNLVFRTMVESVISGQLRTTEAVRNADAEMGLLFNQ